MFPVVTRLATSVEAAITQGRPVVALESTLIAHGLPSPANFETALAAEEAVRAAGAEPATIAVLEGVPTVGLTRKQIEALAKDRGVAKATRRDLGVACARGQTAATTVAATMLLAHQAGIRVLATGGIGGVHRGAADTFDISADLTELARTPVAVVCSGVKSMLDIDKTLEMLETLAVPVIGYQTGEFPAFYERSRGHRLSERVESAWEAAHMVHCHWQFEGAGVLLAQPIAAAAAMSSEEFGLALAVAEAGVDGLSGPAVTPALLAKLAQATKGRSVLANQSLIIANARLAAELAVQLLTIKT